VVRTLLFGLDESSKLHLGKRLLSNNCSSFTFYSSAYGATEQVATHLLVTTKQDLLFIVDINEILLKNGEVTVDSHVNSHPRAKQSKEHITVWEKGAKLVGVIHGDEAAVIIQTTRGNLECMYPRKLVLVSIVQALVQRRFKDAMDMVRRHRIDFNMLVDYCGWKAFIKSAAEFVQEVNNLSYITEFVCSIKNENVSSKLYEAYISFPDECAASVDNENGVVSENKVTSVLMAIRKALEEQTEESSSRELCILTTFARSEPPLLEEALNRIKVIRELELLGVDDARRKLYPSAEESLKHLLWLTEPEAVFNAALGLYDLNLAAIVALNSQKDPKEFLPFLNSLECLPPAIMRYTVDLKLGRYESALRNIVSAGNEYHEDCMGLLNSNPQLFPLGLQLFSDPDKRHQILEAWGDHLFEEKSFGEAAITYQCCFSYQKSLKAYHACGDWRGVFTVAGLLKFEKEQILQLAQELCDEFQALGKSGDAAKIALEYCCDVDRGVGCYITAREWEEALRVAYMHGRQDLVDTVRDAALECAALLISEYQEGLLKVGKYLARYVAVRQRRLSLAAKLQSEDRFMDVEDDNISEVSSSFSEMSAYTTRSVIQRF
jgi:elongator complex protein 1